MFEDATREQNNLLKFYLLQRTYHQIDIQNTLIENTMLYAVSVNC